MNDRARHHAAGLQAALEDHVATCAGAGRDCSGCVIAGSVHGPLRRACADGDAARLWRSVIEAAPRAMACPRDCGAGVDLLALLMAVTREDFGRHLGADVAPAEHPEEDLGPKAVCF